MWFLLPRQPTIEKSHKAYAWSPKRLGPSLDPHPWREIEKGGEKEFVTGEKVRSRPAMVVERHGG